MQAERAPSAKSSRKAAPASTNTKPLTKRKAADLKRTPVQPKSSPAPKKPKYAADVLSRFQGSNSQHLEVAEHSSKRRHELKMRNLELKSEKLQHEAESHARDARLRELKLELEIEKVRRARASGPSPSVQTAGASTSAEWETGTSALRRVSVPYLDASRFVELSDDDE